MASYADDDRAGAGNYNTNLTGQLNASANAITSGNPSYYAPNIGKITIAPAVLR